MGRTWYFRFFDGSVEAISDGGLGIEWVRAWAVDHLFIRDVWQVSSGNYIVPGYEFFS